MKTQRRSYEAGHKPKFLVIVDDTPECDRAIYFATRRCARIGGTVLMCRVIGTKDRNQQWLGVADIMRQEAHDEARTVLAQAAARARAIADIAPEQVIREGETAEEILDLIEEDEDIVILVLAAGTGKEGPGPLVTLLGKSFGTFPIPIAIVPGQLTDPELDSLS
ncbi:MAG TPA: universal stress protein [Xanthobacteraceae bacterium]|nr:universal stress protein [Xanthobacteraceae bacterium]